MRGSRNAATSHHRRARNSKLTGDCPTAVVAASCPAGRLDHRQRNGAFSSRLHGFRPASSKETRLCRFSSESGRCRSMQSTVTWRPLLALGAICRDVGTSPVRRSQPFLVETPQGILGRHQGAKESKASGNATKEQSHRRRMTAFHPFPPLAA
jgi:hypothetical protein